MAGAKDRVEGDVNKAVGAAKKNAGKGMGDEKLEAKGTAQEGKGKAQSFIGKVKSKLS